MPWARIRRSAIWLVPLVLAASAIYGVYIAVAGGTDDPPPLEDLLAECRSLEEQEAYAEGLRTVITALEDYPDNAWDPKAYKRAFEWAWGWFTSLSEADREALLAEYEGSGPDDGMGSGPPLGELLSWLDALSPSTSLSSPGAQLALAIWHHLQGDDARFAGYGLGVVQEVPGSLTADFAITYLMGVRFYAGDQAGMLPIAQAAAELAPNSRGAGWAVFRCVLCYGCDARRVDQAKQLCEDIQTTAPGTVAGNVAAQMSQFIAHVESMAYAQAIEQLWQLQDYMDPGPIQHLIDALAIGVDWLAQRTDPAAQGRINAIIAAGEAEAANPDPQRHAFGVFIQARMYQRQGYKRRSAELFQQAADSELHDVRGYALCQVGRSLSSCDPKGAITALEQYRAGYGLEEGAEAPLMTLARAYRRVGRYQDGLDLCEELQRRCETGYAVVDVRGELFTAEMVACLRGLGRDDEADALAGQGG